LAHRRRSRRLWPAPRACARASVAELKILLLDEPFSARDSLTRADLQMHLLELWSVDRQTMILVAHDIEEASRLPTKSP